MGSTSTTPTLAPTIGLVGCREAAGSSRSSSARQRRPRIGQGGSLCGPRLPPAPSAGMPKEKQHDWVYQRQRRLSILSESAKTSALPSKWSVWSESRVRGQAEVKTKATTAPDQERKRTGKFTAWSPPSLAFPRATELAVARDRDRFRAIDRGCPDRPCPPAKRTRH